MTAILMLPKCAAGKCAWSGCTDAAVSRVLRMRVSHTTVADVRFCRIHARYVCPGSLALAGRPVPTVAA